MSAFSPAVLSLAALLAAIVLSCTSSLNVGLLSFAFAWLIGVFAAGMRPDEIAAGFPTSLFLTIVGVTFLFSGAETNGTMRGLAERALRVTRGDARWIPVVFFVVAMGLSTLGAGAVATTPMIAPAAMTLGMAAGAPPFLLALVVANGANAGNLSPLSPVGVIANSSMAKAGLVGHETVVWFANFAAHVVVTLVALAFFARRRRPAVEATTGTAEAIGSPAAWTAGQRWTLAALVVFATLVVGFRQNVGFAGFATGAFLLVVRATDEAQTIRRMPWSAILMVCGVATLISVLEKTGGLDLFAGLVASLAAPGTVNGVLAFVTGVISTWSSTSGVVLPAFLPTIPALIERVGGGDPLALALSINVGSSLVDVSPLSTIGALCVAAVGDPEESKRLFRRLLAWGLSMTVVGAALSQLFAPLLANA